MDKDLNKDLQDKDQQTRDGHPYGQKESTQDKFNKCRLTHNLARMGFYASQGEIGE